MRPRPLLFCLALVACGDKEQGGGGAVPESPEPSDTADTASADDTGGTAGPLDADGDGFDQETDCDDTDPAVHPDADEVGCDGVDNDCDGSIDRHTVPSTYATLQDAVDAVGQGSEICVEPGTYAERLDLTGRTLTITGRAGPAETTLDLAGELPLLTVDNLDDEGVVDDSQVGALTLRGFTVTGIDRAEVTQGDPIEGGLLRLAGSEAHLEDLVFTGHSAVLRDGGDLRGLLVRASSATLSLVEISVSDVTITYEQGSAEGSLGTEGGLIYSTESDLDLMGLEVSEFDVSSVGEPSSCYATGGVLFLDGGALTGSDLSMTDSHLGLACTESAQQQGWFARVSGAAATVSGLSVTGCSVSLSSPESATSYGVLSLVGWSETELESTWAALDLSDNDLTTTSQTASYVYGTAHVDDPGATVTHLTAHANTLRAEVTLPSHSGYAFGGGLYLTEGAALEHVDLRGNDIYGYRGARGGGVHINPVDSAPALQQVIAAGNTAEAVLDSARGGGIDAWTFSQPLDLHFGDVVGNAVISTGEADAHGGGLFVGSMDKQPGTATVSHLNIVDNSVSSSGGEGAGSAVLVTELDALSWTYTNVPAQGADTWSGMDDPVGTDGNLAQDPVYTDISSADPAAWDLRLHSVSPSIDAGDPALLDADGTTADIGAYGGSGGDSW